MVELYYAWVSPPHSPQPVLTFVFNVLGPNTQMSSRYNFLCCRKALSCSLKETIFTLWLIWSHFGCMDTQPSHILLRFIHYATVILTKLCCTHKKIFTETVCTLREEFSALLIDYNSCSSISWEPNLWLTQIFSSELKNARHSVRILCLGTLTVTPDAHHVWVQLNRARAHLFKWASWTMPKHSTQRSH